MVLSFARTNAAESRRVSVSMPATFVERLRRYAEVIVRIGLNLQPGQRLLIAEPFELQGVSRAAAGLVEAVRMAAPAYIVPFMFVYEPSLLTIGEWDKIVTSCISAIVGVICLAGSLQGHLLREARVWERIAPFGAAIALIKPGLVTDAIGLGLLAVVLVAQKLHRPDRNPAVVDAVAGDASPLERQ